MEQKLTKMQKNVLSELFNGKIESEILESTKISPGLYRNWLRSDVWKKAFAERMEACQRQAQLMLSNFLVTATIKLIGLTESNNEETARKACLDILEMKSLISETVEQATPKTQLTDKNIQTIMRILTDTAKDTGQSKNEQKNQS